MTIEEVLQAASQRHRLIVQSNQVFFNTFDPDVVEFWEREGAHAQQWYTAAELARQRQTGRNMRQGYEVVLNKAVEPVLLQDDEGEVIDITRELLVERARSYAA